MKEKMRDKEKISAVTTNSETGPEETCLLPCFGAITPVDGEEEKDHEGKA